MSTRTRFEEEAKGNLEMAYCLTWLANEFAAVSKVHDLITCESKLQAVVSLGSCKVLFAVGC